MTNPQPTAVKATMDDYERHPKRQGWEAAQVEVHAQHWIAEFFKGRRGRPLALSRIAVADGAAVGVALFRDNDDIPFLDLLYIHPNWQRQGLATALVAQAVNTLHRARIPLLTSRYDLANTASRDWHRRFGFVDCAGWHPGICLPITGRNCGGGN